MTNDLSVLNTTAADSISLKQCLWLHAIVFNLPQGILLINEEQKIIFINQQLCNVFELKQPPESFNGLHIMDFFGTISSLFADISEIAQKINELIEKKETAFKEALQLTNDKILSRDYLPVWADQNFVGHLWLFTDDTENIKAAELIKERKQFYENMLNHIPEDVAVFSPSFKYIYINEIAMQDAELRKWLIGKTDLDYAVLRNKDAEIAEQRIRFFEKVIAEKKEYEWEENIINREGIKQTFLRKLVPVYDKKQNLKFFIGYGINITKQKQFEANIQQAEKKLKNIFNFSQALICTHDVNGKILSANSATCETLGYDEEEITGKWIQDFLFIEDKETVNEVYLHAINTTKKIRGIFKAMKKNGEKIYLLYQSYQLEEPDSAPYIIAVAQDITERIEEEKKFKKEQKIAEEKVRSKEKLMEDLRANIRTPLNGILGINSLLQKTVVNTEQAFYLNIIEESAQKLLELISVPK
ncbi:MAG: PAS domain S-box protein [Chitinophagaceae bacterium]